MIAPGRLADMILIGRNPLNVPAFNTDSNAVYATSGLAVSTTICDGVILMHDGVIPGAEKIMEKAGSVAFDLVERATSA